MRLEAESGSSWWGSLGTSLALHGAVGIGVLSALVGARRPPPEAPDIWQGSMVTVDTVSDTASPGIPAEPAAPLVPAPSPLVPATPEVLPATAVKQVAVARTAAKTPPKSREPRDPNEALLAKVMGFVPNSRTGSESSASGLSRQSSDPGAVPGGSAQQTTVRNLPKAFTRALPYAADGAAAQWSKLPLGKADQTRVTITVGASGEILDHSLPREASQRMKELARRTVALLGAGQFALRNTQVSAGAMTLQLDVWLSVEPDAKVGYSHKSPSPAQEGEAVYTSSTGWTFKAKVREVR